MKKYLTSIFFSLILLTGCTNFFFHPVNKVPIYSCKVQCLKQLKHCEQVCDNSCGMCVALGKQRVVKNYRHYLQQQIIQGKEVPRDLKSYRDPLQCRKISCNCVADLEQCIQFCTGAIHKRLQVAPTCC